MIYGTKRESDGMNSNQILNLERLRVSQDTRQLLLRTAIIISMLALSAGAGVAVGLEKMIVALLFGIPTVALVGWLLLTRKFELLVLILPVTAMIAPIDIPTGTYSRIPIALMLTIVLCVVWFATMIVRKKWSFAPTSMNRPAVVFCIVCLLSFGWSSVWRDPVINMSNFGNFTVVQVASLLTFYASIGAAVLIGNFAQSELRLKFIFYAFIVIGTIMTVTELLHVNTGTLLTINGLWGLWTVLPAFCYLILQERVRWYTRILLIGVIALNLYQTIIVNLQWKSGWIPTIIGIYVAVFLRSKKWFAVLLLATVLAGYIGREELVAMTQAEEEEGADQRLGMWEINLRVVGDHWLLGTGPAGYAVYYMSYFPEDARSTHNNYLDIIAQFGIAGTIAWFWFAIAGTLEGLRLMKIAPPGFMRVLAWTATSGWIAAQSSMFLGDWLLPFAYNQTITGFKFTVYSWIFLGTLIAIRAILASKPVESVKEYAV